MPTCNISKILATAWNYWTAGFSYFQICWAHFTKLKLTFIFSAGKISSNIYKTLEGERMRDTKTGKAKRQRRKRKVRGVKDRREGMKEERRREAVKVM